MVTLVYSPLAGGMVTGRIGAGQETDLGQASKFRHVTDERRLDSVEQLIPLADQARLSLTHLAMAFTIAHPGVTSAILGPRAMEFLEDLLTGIEMALSDDLLDAIDAIVPPGTDIGQLDMADAPPAVQHAHLRRRPAPERSAA